MSETVNVPPELDDIFRQAQRTVSEYFQTLHLDPARGTIEAGGQRYVLVRAASMSVEFFQTIAGLYADQGADEARAVARSLLYDLAYAVGAADARAFNSELSVDDAIARLSTGPVHFAHTGWALVELLPESRPVADASYVLVYNHPYSFESDAWIAAGKRVDFPVCIMNAGYSAGWCSESFGRPLVAVEICCKAMGDECCRFVMAPPEHIEHEIGVYVRQRPALARSRSRYEIPGFFSRKRVEDELRQREAQYRSIFESSIDAIMVADGNGMILAANPAAGQLYGRPVSELVGMSADNIAGPGTISRMADVRRGLLEHGSWTGELTGRAADGRVFEVDVRASAFSTGAEPQILVLARDISARKLAEAERLRIQEALLRQNATLRQERAVARTVQLGLLPAKAPWSPDTLSTAARSLPASEVGGDFYVYSRLANEQLLLVIGDVSGKGVGAALMMALTVSVVDAEARVASGPAMFLSGLGERIREQITGCGMFVSVLALAYDPGRRRLTIASAGMPPPVLLRDGSVRAIESLGLPLGLATSSACGEVELDLRPGDTVVAVTDGIVEARSQLGEVWGYTRLESAVSHAAGAPGAVVDAVLQAATAFAHRAEQHDDMTLLAFAVA